MFLINSSSSPLVRIAIFYDGSFFMNVSNYFRHFHSRQKNITFSGFHEFVRHKAAEKEKQDVSFSQIVEAHFFRGRFSLTAAKTANTMESDRFIDQLLMYAGIVSHFYPMGGMIKKCGNRKKAAATFRVTQPTGLMPGYERRHRHEGGEHSRWGIVKL
jgi:hypothetical protein